ncbi:MAG: hypothetical protein IJY59_10065 [Bacteroidaceae bacterium]|nr:hypothetical protein [Bacteroidaceae bacterium]
MKIVFELLVSAGIAALVLLVIYGAAGLAVNLRNRYWRHQLETIEIGARYIRVYDSEDPFDEKYGAVVVIEDKQVNKYGEPYVKYRLKGSMFDGTSVSLRTFIEVYKYVPYTGQDKEGCDE